MKLARLVPELTVSDLARSLAFWRDLVGFVVADPDGYLLRLAQDLGSRPV